MAPSFEDAPKTKLAARPSRRGPVEGRYGAFTWRGLLAKGPGVILAEAIDVDGTPRLLQIVRCRPVRDDAERLRRLHLERVISQRTAGLLEEGVIAHGVETELDGTRALYWILPWEDRYAELALPERPDIGLIVRAGMVLASRLMQRHARGRTEPLLSAQLLLLGDAKLRATLVGLPVFVPPEWLADEMEPPSLAPEELVRAQLEPSGDLWRLGRTLRRLMEMGEVRSAPLADIIARLEKDDRSLRTPRASQALAELEALAAELDGLTRAGPTALFAAMDPSQLSELLLDATVDAPSVSAPLDEPAFESVSALYAPVMLDTMIDSHVRLIEADAKPAKTPRPRVPQRPAIELDARAWRPSPSAEEEPAVGEVSSRANPLDAAASQGPSDEAAPIPLDAAFILPLAPPVEFDGRPTDPPEVEEAAIHDPALERWLEQGQGPRFIVHGPAFAFWMLAVSILAFALGVGLALWLPR